MEDKLEQVTRRVLHALGSRINVKDGAFRKSALITNPSTFPQLENLAKEIRPGRIIFIDGESGNGKGALLAALDAFIPGYNKDDDYGGKSASTVLASDDSLSKATDQAQKRKTCLVLDELQDVGAEGLGRFKARFTQKDFAGDYVVICCGHYDELLRKDRDVSSRIAFTYHLKSYSDLDRKLDIPFLVAFILRDPKTSWKGQAVSALAMRELLRFDYKLHGNLNWRGLQKLVELAVKRTRGDVLTWEDLAALDGPIGNRQKPNIPELEYDIVIG